jgi:hypothetical protein
LKLSITVFDWMNSERTEAMKNKRSMKTLKLAVIAALASFACLQLAWQMTSASGSGQSGRRFEIVGFEASLDERTGKDDGAAFAIQFIGDTHGGLEPCG